MILKNVRQYDQFGHAAFEGGAGGAGGFGGFDFNGADFGDIFRRYFRRSVWRRREEAEDQQWSDERRKYPKECPNHI